MPDPNPDQLVQQMRQYVAAVQELIDEYERGQEASPQPEPAAERARRRWGLPLAVLLGVGYWLRERYAVTVAAAGAATIAVAVGWLAGQAPDDQHHAGPAPTVTVTRSPSPSVTTVATTPEADTSSTRPSDRQVTSPQTPGDVEGEPAADEEPSATTPPVVDDEQPDPTAPPDVTTPPPGDSDDGEVTQPKRRCLVVKVGDLPLRVCRRG